MSFQKMRRTFKAVCLRRFSLLLILLAALPGGLLLAQDSPDRVRRVLVIYENESTLPAVVQVAAGLSDSMRRNMPLDIEIYSEYLDTVRFAAPATVAHLAEYLSGKYSGVKFDVVIAGGPGALQFALDHRSEIGGNAPIVFGGVSDSSLSNRVLPADVKGVVSHFDVRKTIDLGLALQPDATGIVVMTGSADFDKSWQATARTALGDRYGNMPVVYISGLSISGFKAAARNLSRKTILLVLNIFQDADGRKFIPRDATRAIAEVSKAPIYSVYSSHFGSGVLGGYVGTFNSVGEDMGALAARVMAGDLSAPQTSLVKDGPLVDWTQVVRWGIDPARIPEHADILNYELSPWQTYRLQILATLAVILLLGATIVALFLERQRKIRLQTELNLERLELAYLSRTSQLGELSGALAHELNQPLTSILANAETGSRLLDSDTPDIKELREILDDIVLDNRRAATVITQLRRLMIRGETNLEPMDLNHAATTTLALARSELLSRQTDVDLILDMPEVRIRGNLTQLQQVLLNLLLNATDAMAHLPASCREIAIQTRKREDGTCELTVTDRGVGIAGERRTEVFKPFVSTKKSSLGLGLAICRTIIQAHGGTLEFDETVKEGARAILTLPSI
jgi:signal transduction histidine kinase